MDLKEMEKALKAPFHPDEIEWRVGSTTKDKKRGMALAYVTNRAIQNRLDEVFGIGGWRNEFKEWRTKGVLCGISCRFANTAPGMIEWITKWDGADETNFEATKGGFSDSMKRAAVEWGIGRYLYGIDATWVSIDEYGKIVGEPPKLPEWALPEGFTYSPSTKSQNRPQNTPQGQTEVKQLPKEELLMFQNFQKELKETLPQFLKRLSISVDAMAQKYNFPTFKLTMLNDLAKLDQVMRDELSIVYRKKIDQIKTMTDQEQGGQQTQANKCGCGKAISAEETAYCNSKGIKVACRVCQRKDG